MTARDPVDVRGPVVRGIRWNVVSQAVVQASRVVTVVVLARLLVPEDYGLAAMALAFAGIALVVTELGLGTALIQRPEIDERDRSTMFWTNAALGLLCTLAGVALAGPVASLYREPEVRPLFVALSLGFLLPALGATQRAVLARALDYRSLELAAIAGTLAGSVAAIAVAATGGGAWAIVAGQLAGGAATLAALWLLSGWRPSLVFSRANLRDLGGFGTNLLGTRLLFYAHRNVDTILVGRVLGAPALGAYALAYNLILLPFARVVDPIRGLLLPALARLQTDRERVAAVWLRVTRLLAAAFLPAMLGLVAVAPDAVPVVLGERWDAAVPVVQILAGVGLLQSIASLNSVVLPVLDRTGALLRVAFATFVLSLAGFVAGLPFGITGVAAGYLGANILVVPIYTAVTARALGLSLRRVAHALGGVAQSAFVMVVAVVAARLALVEADVAEAVRLAVLVPLGATVYAVAAALRAPGLRSDLAWLRRPQVQETGANP